MTFYAHPDECPDCKGAGWKCDRCGGTGRIEIERPSPPLPSARDCTDCGMIKDDTGETHGWGLCDCGSFRRNPL